MRRSGVHVGNWSWLYTQQLQQIEDASPRPSAAAEDVLAGARPEVGDFALVRNDQMRPHVLGFELDAALGEHFSTALAVLCPALGAFSLPADFYGAIDVSHVRT